MKSTPWVVAVLALSLGAAIAADSLPAGAAGFAGMVNGKVVAKGTDRITIEVTGIAKTWAHSTAEKPEAMVGKQIVLVIKPGIYDRKPGYLALVRGFFDLLKVGDSEVFDVKDGADGTLVFLELTEAQKKRVEPRGR